MVALPGYSNVKRDMAKRFGEFPSILMLTSLCTVSGNHRVSHNITTLPSTLAHFEMTDKCNKTTANNRQGNTQATSVNDMSTSVFRCYSDDETICLSD